jgi:hypothetical protein
MAVFFSMARIFWPWNGASTKNKLFQQPGIGVYPVVYLIIIILVEKYSKTVQLQIIPKGSLRLFPKASDFLGRNVEHSCVNN